ncbi:HHR074Wp [Eremothecium sinecaudum]|uniref:HHR074Wp n=1 Tax=Eremothecium sinecaudum TaxID=45286 RepID=A0A109V0H1_9SACH|nr:HHR074Wp [Eremothecium sinecaudum]AMD22843.1 HHR074Wp [Eremothecium sinecaudum]
MLTFPRIISKDFCAKRLQGVIRAKSSLRNLDSNEAQSKTAVHQPDAQATTMCDGYEFSRLLMDWKSTVGEGYKATWLNALEERKKQAANGNIIDSYLYKNVKHNEIVSKNQRQSFSYLKLPFKDDPITADFYCNAAGRMRMGQIFQDLDALAGRIAYRHVFPAEPIIVTASVDRIYMLKNLESIKDFNLVLSGAVVWSGRSSMEIEIKAHALNGKIPDTVTQENLQDKDLILSAWFTFVAKDPETRKSFMINKLIPSTNKELVDFSYADNRNSRKRLRASKANLYLHSPYPSESNMMHRIWTASNEIAAMKPKPKNIVFMKDTNMKSTMFMQPQYRNRHSYMIFGGYLMRQTFELAYCAASSASHTLPRFLCLDQTTFCAPVPVGSILHMDAKVVYTEDVRPKDVSETSPSKVEHKTEAEKNTFANLQAPPFNTVSEDPSSILSSPGTLIQVKVSTQVQELASEKKTQSGTFVFSFFAVKDSVNPSDPVNKNVADSFTVVPETYSEMIEYLDGRRRTEDTVYHTDVFKGMKNT